MNKRKITVLSATVLLAIVAFPLLSAAATGGAPTRNIESFVMGTSGCQMNIQLDQNNNLVSANVGPAYVTPAFVSACPTNAYCNDGCNIFDTGLCGVNYYCPDLSSNPPPTGQGMCECWSNNPSDFTWSCHNVVDGVACQWLDRCSIACTESVFLTAPTCSVPPVPAPIIYSPTTNAPASSCNDLQPTLGFVDDSLACEGCALTDGVWGCAKCEIRQSVERNIMEELAGTCTYKYTLATGRTSTSTIACGKPGCACGVQDGCKCGTSECPYGGSTGCP